MKHLCLTWSPTFCTSAAATVTLSSWTAPEMADATSRSTTADGTKHLAQCKFHAGVTAAVGARETDELPIALLKFGAKRGLFVTTARLSPQSKREYLGDFPGFELEFWDGVQLVDHVLSSPLLSDLWIEEDSVRRRAVSVAIPFIVRRAHDDRPIRVDPAPFRTAEHSVSFLHVSAPASVFTPYRSPKVVDSSESGGQALWCQEAVLTGTSDLRGLSKHLPEVVASIGAELSRELTYTVRLGRPSLVPLTSAPAGESGDGDRLVVDGATSRSFVVAPDGTVHDERDWVVPTSDMGRSRPIYPLQKPTGRVGTTMLTTAWGWRRLLGRQRLSRTLTK